jgi:2-dehydro-3-deoxygalactonokinase
MKKFLSCDWGTSSFRLRIIEVPGLAIIAEENSGAGIVSCFELWKQSGKKEEDRLSFYLDIINRHIKVLEEKSNSSLDEVPLIISGMASSTMGMIHLPYKELPFLADGSGLEIKIIEAGNNFLHKTAIIPGAKTKDDIMRGEETQLAGCFHDNDNEGQIFIFPGTHSKHVLVKKGKAVDIKTYMTGEFFELLSKKSILSVSIEEGNDLHFEKNLRSFEKGVKDSGELNILHSCFHIRTNDLFGKLTKQENYYYLSGLLTGTEIKDLINEGYSNLTLVSNAVTGPYYEAAFSVLNINNGRHPLKIQNADKALIQGQFKVAGRLLNIQ